MCIVECENVRKIYRKGTQEVVALDGVSLKIKKGEFLALAGPSGSGKTTLFNVLGGLDRVDEGCVILDGDELNQLTDSRLAELRLRKIGIIFQSFNLIPVLSALENVEFVMLLQGIPPAERNRKAKELLGDVGLGGLYARRPAELSGGQQQRVAVARALAGNPAIVLADEPTANLDSQTGARLLALMKEMNQTRKVTFIFSTHDRMVMEYASRLVHIKDGRIRDE
ncbi:MAG: ABC transporter ATP-binding protein [Deltaproteobacteria bacterium]|jgi:putative ABC transport system ATP-binding protein|nr:ABC transporter ATP-binding protein [Deltaproteobacteria bacterium]